MISWYSTVSAGHINCYHLYKNDFKKTMAIYEALFVKVQFQKFILRTTRYVLTLKVKLSGTIEILLVKVVIVVLVARMVLLFTARWRLLRHDRCQRRGLRHVTS